MNDTEVQITKTRHGMYSITTYSSQTGGRSLTLNEEEFLALKEAMEEM